MKKMVVFLLLAFVLLSACQPSPAEPEQAAPDEGAVQTAIAQTAAAQPTETSPPPTETAEPEPTEVPPTEAPVNTPLPEGILFRDDFNGAILPDWTIESEIPERWSISDEGEVVIIATIGGVPYTWDDANNHQDNLFLIPAPGGEYMITTHIRTDVFMNFHQAAIIIYEDPDNWMLLNRGYCDLCVPGGDGIFMDYKIEGAGGGYKIPFKADDVYLRIVHTEGRYESYYAEKEGEWTRLGRVGGYIEPEKLGFGASNRAEGDDMTAYFDYFEVARP